MIQREKPRSSLRGFSLIEVVAVCVILAIVASLALPRFLVVERGREEKAILEVEDLLRMFAFRNSIATQQIGLQYDDRAREVSLWILDLNPKDPEGPRVWQQDRLSTVVELPDSMRIDYALEDEVEKRDERWAITSHPDGSRPRITVSLLGAGTAGVIVLENHSNVPIRTDRQGETVREPIDLDREGRTMERW